MSTNVTPHQIRTILKNAADPQIASFMGTVTKAHDDYIQVNVKWSGIIPEMHKALNGAGLYIEVEQYRYFTSRNTRPFVFRVKKQWEVEEEARRMWHSLALVAFWNMRLESNGMTQNDLIQRGSYVDQMQNQTPGVHLLAPEYQIVFVPADASIMYVDPIGPNPSQRITDIEHLHYTYLHTHREQGEYFVFVERNDWDSAGEVLAVDIDANMMLVHHYPGELELLPLTDDVTVSVEYREDGVMSVAREWRLRMISYGGLEINFEVFPVQPGSASIRCDLTQRYAGYEVRTGWYGTTGTLQEGAMFNAAFQIALVKGRQLEALTKTLPVIDRE